MTVFHRGCKEGKRYDSFAEAAQAEGFDPAAEMGDWDETEEA